MKKLWLIIAFTSGCWGGGYYGGGGGPLRSFETDSSDCNLTSGLTLTGTSTTWNGCRLRYDGASQAYTWQFMTPGTTGTWTSQGAGWFTMSFNLNSPQNQTLPLSSVVAEAPPFVPLDEVVFAYAPVAGATVGGTGSVTVAANIIYPDGDGSALGAKLNVDAVGFGTFSGDVFATIGPAQPGADAAVQPVVDGGSSD